MPRALGQIDARKAQAVLEAAIEVFADRGLSASLEAVALRAGVSKQTIYNQYGSKAELVRALAERRAEELTAPLARSSGREPPQRILEDFARALLGAYLGENVGSLLRIVAQHAQEHPEVAELVYKAGPQASRDRLAAYLAVETRAGRLHVDDPVHAAEIFLGMTLGVVQTRSLMGAPLGVPEGTAARAQECARRFVAAYAA